jgi:hypothetical protein
MASFGYPKYKEKTWEFAWQHFETQNWFWVKIIFNPMIKWKG